jgi:glutaryl-CoA dehydrogenase
MTLDTTGRHTPGHEHTTSRHPMSDRTSPRGDHTERGAGEGPDRPGIAPPIADDALGLRDQLDDDERALLERIEHHSAQSVRGVSTAAWNEDRLARELLPGLADLGMGELTLSGTSHLFQGLAHAAVARADLSISALLGIHNELIIGTIAALGSTDQQRRWLPGLRQLDSLGAFCLTEPEHGSDISGGLATTATRDGDEWVLTGSKRWIGLGTLADLALIWARDTTTSEVTCFAVETSTPGYHAEKIHHKTALRGMQNADVTLDDVRVGAEARLPGAAGFSAANSLLKDSRAWVGWQAVGAQQAILDIVRDYVLGREQFGRPLAGFQLVQQGLAEIAGNLSATAALMAQTARLQSRGELEMSHAALAKSTCTRYARASAALGRELLGGNGISTDFELAKVANDVEAIYTYEGTYQINSLIVGRSLTGISAFA